MAAAIVLRKTRRFCLKIGCLILLAVLAMMTLFNVYTTFSRGNEHLTKKPDFVRSLGSFSGSPLSTERLQRSTGDQRGKVPNVLSQDIMISWYNLLEPAYIRRSSANRFERAEISVISCVNSDILQRQFQNCFAVFKLVYLSFF